MDNKALFKLSYGVFLLGVKAGDKMNACITNTCMQVANDPTRIAICSMKANYTCELIQESQTFALTVLDKDATFDIIKHFGMQSGRDVDKFDGFPVESDVNGNPYMKFHACSVISGRVVDSMDLGTHMMFIAEIDDMEVLGIGEPMTYAYYQNCVKPKPQATPEEKKEKKIVAWRCTICGYIYEGSELPDDYTCPTCGHPKEDFEPIYE
ncbi:MAG: flavin reductase [Eubacterium sp.]|nr:flavin reductase [Eubacterium sp.]